MLAVLLAVLFTLGALGLGRCVVDRVMAKELDPAAHFGLSGLIGLGIIGWVTLPIGLVPGGLRGGLGIVGALALAGLVLGARGLKDWRLSMPRGASILGPLALLAASLISLVGVLAPSDTLDWDSLAYHFAVPKMWLAAGQIEFVSFIHHSNFPFLVDNVGMWGLAFGDQTGFKAFSLLFTLLGSATLFGLARMRYGAASGWWAAVGFQCVPVVIWLSGTGYIDVANGLYAGLGIAFAAWSLGAPEPRRWLILSGIMLGGAAASKYTGLQTIFAVGLVLLVAGLVAKDGVASISRPALVATIALLIACPWYVRNGINTGNPVYPFFYSVFGGKNWDSFSEKIYREEQQTFGAGRAPASAEQPNYTLNPLQPTRLGHSILGLAYQPGRYVNPGPTQGNGLVIGAMGFVFGVTLLLWAFSGRTKRFEGAVLGGVLISLLLWFVLSQQVRYIIALSVPVAILAGGAAVRLESRSFIRGAVGLQAIVSLVLTWMVLVSPPPTGSGLATPLEAALGQVSREEYQSRRVRFFEPAQYLNGAAKGGRVALYDEVFGYFLDVPYFWANPGHTTEIPYAEMNSGEDLMAAFERLGITHVYLNLSIYPRSDANIAQWIAQMGLQGNPVPISPEEWAAKTDPRERWKLVVADAIAKRKLQLAMTFGRSENRMVFRIPTEE